MSEVVSWSPTAADNDSAVPDGFPENMAPSGVNDSAREVMAAVVRQHLLFLVSNWNNRKSGTTQFNAVYNRGSLYPWIVVGESGLIQTSNNAANYTTQTSGTANGLNAVSYGNGHYWTVGDSQTILSSTDLTSWTSRTSALAGDLYGCVYSGTNYVNVLGTGDAEYTSDITAAWTAATTFPSSVNARAVAVANNILIAVGPGGGGGARSTDHGVNWSAVSAGLNLYGIAAGTVDGVANSFVAVGNGGLVKYSKDAGATWSTATAVTSENLKAVCWNGVNCFVAVGENGVVIHSYDGVTWYNRGNILYGAAHAYGIHAGSTTDVFVAAGASGYIWQSLRAG